MTPTQLKEIRKSLGMTISDMADYLGCNNRFVRAMETEEFNSTGQINKSHRIITPETECLINKLKEK